jgi:hypothetical protein
MLFPILEKKSHTDSHTEKVLFCIMALLYKFGDTRSCLEHRKMMLDSFQKEYKNQEKGKPRDKNGKPVVEDTPYHWCAKAIW